MYSYNNAIYDHIKALFSASTFFFKKIFFFSGLFFFIYSIDKFRLISIHPWRICKISPPLVPEKIMPFALSGEKNHKSFISPVFTLFS